MPCGKSLNACLISPISQKHERRMAPILCLALLLLIGCSNTTPFKQPIPPVRYHENPDQRPDHPQVITFYALGDWGTGDNRQIAVAQALKEDVALLESREEKRRIPPFVLGLGDNIYSDGLPVGWDTSRVHPELRRTFGNIYKNVTYQGQNLVYHIIPGNHDHRGDIIHQETTAEHLFQDTTQ